MTRKLKAEWWELWWVKPGEKPGEKTVVIFLPMNGQPIPPWIPDGCYPSKEAALKEKAKEGNKYTRLFHVRRYAKADPEATFLEATSLPKTTNRRCSHRYYSEPLHPSIRIGGAVVVGQCENECFPGLVVCFEHANKDTLALLAQQLENENRRLRGKGHGESEVM